MPSCGNTMKLQLHCKFAFRFRMNRFSRLLLKRLPRCIIDVLLLSESTGHDLLAELKYQHLVLQLELRFNRKHMHQITETHAGGTIPYARSLGTSAAQLAPTKDTHQKWVIASQFSIAEFGVPSTAQMPYTKNRIVPLTRHPGPRFDTKICIYQRYIPKVTPRDSRPAGSAHVSSLLITNSCHWLTAAGVACSSGHSEPCWNATLRPCQKPATAAASCCRRRAGRRILQRPPQQPQTQH